MSRAGGVADGIAAAIEMPRARTSGLGHRMQDGDATVPVFSAQLDALMAAANTAEAGADPTTGEGRDTVDAGQKLQHSRESENVVESKLGLIPATLGNLRLLDEAATDEGRTGTPRHAAVDESATSQHDVEPLEKAAIPRSPMRHTSPTAMKLPEGLAQARADRVGRPIGAHVQDRSDVSLALGRTDSPNRDAAGRADAGASGLHQRAQSIDAPARASHASRPLTGRAVAKAAVDRQSLRGGGVPVRVVRQETHLPPAERLSPAVQVANAVAAGLRGAEELRPVRGATGLPPEPPTAAPVVRVLQVRLEPPELGTVSVRMRLDANALEVRIDARQQGTADLLRSDQGALTRLLRSAGYDVEALTVHISEPDRSVAGTSPAQQSPQSGSHQSVVQSHSGSAQPDGRSGGAHQHADRRNEAAEATAADAGTEPPASGIRGAGGVWV